MSYRGVSRANPGQIISLVILRLCLSAGLGTPRCRSTRARGGDLKKREVWGYLFKLLQEPRKNADENEDSKL